MGQLEGSAAEAIERIQYLELRLSRLEQLHFDLALRYMDYMRANEATQDRLEWLTKIQWFRKVAFWFHGHLGKIAAAAVGAVSLVTLARILRGWF